ncbi:RDD family protein [Paenibacillus fonticola]|uniref:RDD family protein n=1 Tax=Paenibacillus fonticola TaxID=379896 RepID=UPI00036CE4E1|nr:RDD family protein [Paenibacillus fonticola]
MKQGFEKLPAPPYRPISMLLRRMGAALIDYLLFAALIRSAMNINQLFMLQRTHTLFVLFGVIFLVLAYYVLLEGSTGYTFGKWLLQIRVVDKTGHAPGFAKALVRTAFRLIDSNPLLLGGFPAAFSILLTERRQRIGDLAAGSYVVKSRDLPLKEKERGSMILVPAFTILMLLAAAAPGMANGVLSALKQADFPPKSGNSEKVHISHNGQFKITTSPDWLFDPGLDNEADISISNRFTKKYLSVFSEPKERFRKDWTLEQYLQYAEKSFAQGLKQSPIYKPHPISINGYSAYQFAVEQEVNGAKVAYIVTTVETARYYHWITVWTDAAKYKEFQKELHAVIRSFDTFST